MRLRLRLTNNLGAQPRDIHQREHGTLTFRMGLFLFLLQLTLYPTINSSAQMTLPDYTVERVYEIPFVTSMVWAPDGRMFFTEKGGLVHVAQADGSLQADPVVQLDARTLNEEGLQSIVLDPEFATNHYFYVYYTEADPAPDDPLNPFRNLVVRYTEVDGVATDPVTMLEFPVDDSGGHNHNGGRLRFGPDGYLYLSVGDLNHYNVYAQDPLRIEGKIHRFAVTDSGLQPAPDNPFPDSSVWAYGLRNAFSFVFDPLSDQLFSTENGPDCDDEVNRIERGGNYGWGIVPLPDGVAYEGYCERPERHFGAIEPLVTYAPTIAPTGIMIYDGAAFPEWYGDLFFCAFKPFEMYHVELDETRMDFASEIEVLSPGTQPGCAIEVAQGPDDLIYYTNTVGIYQIRPAPRP